MNLMNLVKRAYWRLRISAAKLVGYFAPSSLANFIFAESSFFCTRA
jgi:hypothetical protein